MDLSYGPEHDAFRAEVAAFLDEHWHPGQDKRAGEVAQFRERATKRGYLYRSVPRRFGGAEQEHDPERAQVIREEFDRARAPREVSGVGVALLVPTLLHWGTPAQQERFIPPTIAGTMRWCQGYSEPDAGSDLESLRTTATLADQSWVINGQKVWTSQAHHADWMFLLARTESVPRRAGLSYLLLDMASPGIEVRPLRQITGSAEFNEVFLTDVQTPADLLVGERGAGWAVSRTTLSVERTTFSSADSSAALLRSLVKLVRRRELAGRPAIEDVSVRRRIVALHAVIESQRCSALVQATRAGSGEPVGTMPLLNKLLHTQIVSDISGLALDVLGPAALLDPAAVDRPGDERWLNQLFGSLGVAIAGGTSNIQRNIVAERGLGLPRTTADAV